MTDMPANVRASLEAVLAIARDAHCIQPSAAVQEWIDENYPAPPPAWQDGDIIDNLNHDITYARIDGEWRALGRSNKHWRQLDAWADLFVEESPASVVRRGGVDL